MIFFDPSISANNMYNNYQQPIAKRSGESFYIKPEEIVETYKFDAYGNYVCYVRNTRTNVVIKKIITKSNKNNNDAENKEWWA